MVRLGLGLLTLTVSETETLTLTLTLTLTHAGRCRNQGASYHLLPCSSRVLLQHAAPTSEPCRRRESRARTPGCSHSKGEEHLVMDLLGNMRNGTFVEIGGNDGLSTTNTYHLERCLGWQGPDRRASGKLQQDG